MKCRENEKDTTSLNFAWLVEKTSLKKTTHVINVTHAFLLFQPHFSEITKQIVIHFRGMGKDRLFFSRCGLEECKMEEQKCDGTSDAGPAPYHLTKRHSYEQKHNYFIRVFYEFLGSIHKNQELFVPAFLHTINHEMSQHLTEMVGIAKQYSGHPKTRELILEFVIAVVMQGSFFYCLRKKMGCYRNLQLKKK